MTHPAFRSIRNRAIPSLHIELQEYRHRLTGAHHIHLSANDSNNVFLVAFLTVPQNSTGVAHILEHTVLCGSQRYPVRDPFFMMTRRSLNTFMNAFTASDWTAYPFATQNRKDFKNLLDVYLDAVFFPILNELDFAQEGHRTEFMTPDDPGSALVFKGVVFNEMKGAMSSPINKLAQVLQNQLFPTTTYHYNSGGEPENIPDLTHAQLQAFHVRHYHPANAIFFTYGDIPASEHQAQFEERALGSFQTQALDFSVPDEQRFTTPLSVETVYALDGEDDLGYKTHIVLGWLLGKNTNPRMVLEARILADALLDNSSSPLRQALETSSFGTAPSPLCGFDDSTRETTFVAGLEGSNPEHAQAVEDLILGVIETVAERGIPQETLESVLHQLELNQREITGDGYPYGLHLILDALTPTIYGGDPLAALDLDALMGDLHEAIKKPSFIKGLARDLLLENRHRVRLVMAPDPSLNARQAEREARRLAIRQATMSGAEKAQLLNQMKALHVRQSQLDDPELLPRVSLEDIPAELKIAEGDNRPVADLPVAWYVQGTNGMIYQQLVIDLPALDDALLDLLPFFCLCVTEVGSGDRDYLKTQALQAAVTGGINARCVVRSDLEDVQRARGVMVLSGKALSRNHTALMKLITETFNGARFDELPRLRELVSQLRVQREEAVTQHGHFLAMTAAGAGISPAMALTHRWEGLQGLRTLQMLDDALDDEDRLSTFAAKLAQIRDRIKTCPRQLLVVSEAVQQAAIAEDIATHLPSYPVLGEMPPPFFLNPVNTVIRQGWSISTRVNFCAKVYPTVPQNHPDAAALQVLGEFLRNGYLHRVIREQGGAYGAGAGYHTDSGAFRLYSYRDPRLEETLDDFDRALEWLHSNVHPARALEEAILGIIAAIDRPSSPAGEAISAFFGELFGRTAEQRRAFRQKVLQVTLDDLKRVGETHLMPQRASLAVLSDPVTLERRLDLEILAV